MKLVVFYRPKSEHARKVEEFVRDFVHSDPERKIDLVDVDSPYGMEQCQLYDIMEYPSIVAKSDSGELQKSWSGELPLTDELSYYAKST